MQEVKHIIQYTYLHLLSECQLQWHAKVGSPYVIVAHFHDGATFFLEI